MNRLHLFAVVCGLFCFIVPSSYGNSFGAPSEACNTLLPRHGPEPQATLSPYQLTAIKDNSGAITVTVAGGSFKGVVLQARDSSDKSKIVDGTFSDYDASKFKLMGCDSTTKNTITHSSNDAKTKLQATWMPSNGVSGDVTFNGTVVQEFTTFWTGHESESLKIEAITSPQITTQPPPNYSYLYEGCGITHSCVSDQYGCIQSKSCERFVKYSNVSDGIQFSIISTEIDNDYVAIGFSEDSKMGDDSVVACSIMDVVKLREGWNTNSYSNSVDDTNSPNLSEISLSSFEGIMRCDFKHVFTWTSNNYDFDLKKKLYLLIAVGKVNDGEELMKHHSHFASPNAVDFGEFSQAGTDIISSVYDDCNVKKGCFGIPEDCIGSKNCEAFVSFATKSNSVLFEIVGKSPGYTAVGLSKDSIMGDDSVTACMNKNSGTSIIQYWNNYRTPKLLTEPQLGLSQTSGKYINGMLYCSFYRDIQTTINNNVFNLNETEYFLLLANGDVQNDEISYHGGTKWSSGSAVKLTSISLVGKKDSILIKVHGMLMIMAWVGTASIGMILARYFKEVWTDKLLTGVKVWFFYHRVFMISTWILTAAAFVVIFVEIDGLSQVDNPHPYLGIATTVLCIIQPFIALCRCAPDASSRPVFNWVHWFIGNASQILGVVTIFFAVELSKANLPKYFDWILVSFVLFHILFHLMFQAIACATDGKTKKVSDIPLETYNGSSVSASNSTDDKKDVRGSCVRVAILIIYAFINIGFVAAFSILIWIAD